MKKQLFLLVFMLLPLVASAATGIEIDGIFYHFKSATKTAEVARWVHGQKYTGDVVIPSTVTRNEVEYSVTSIEANAFANCSELTSVTIPNSVTSLGKELFNGCPNLASIVVEEGNPVYDSRENCNTLIETASNKVIYGCSASTIPDGITTIGNSAFLNCIGLTSIVIPSSVTTIEKSAFEGCTGLTSFVIPDAVTTIERGIISSCTGLTYLYIGKGITNLEEWMFNSCTNLKKVEINSNAIASNNNYNSQNGFSIGSFFNSSVEEYILGEDVTRISDYAFYRCGMTSIKMSNNVTTIGNLAFSGCRYLASVTLSGNLTSIGDWAFTFCEKLTDMYCYAEQVPKLADAVFMSSNFRNATLHVPAVSVDAYSNAEVWKGFGNIVALTDPSGIESTTATQQPTIIECYTIDGKCINQPQRGFNIIKMSDGTTKKIVVK